MTKNCKQCNREFLISKEELIFCSSKCRVMYLKKCKRWRNNNKQLRRKIAREYYKKSKKRRDYQKEYDRKRKESGYFDRYNRLHKKEKRDWQRNSRKDINKRIKYNLRKRIWEALKNNSKSKHTLELLGCSIEYLKLHLESKFTLGMSWSNYGKWHVDHIIPCRMFNLNVSEEQLKCFHYTNLQPLWAKDNLIKHNIRIN